MQDSRALSSLVLATSILVAAAAMAGSANAQSVRFCGVVRATGRTCLTVPGSMGATGRIFDISSVTPRPRRNSTISGSGTVRGISHCSRATGRLAHVSWRRVSVCPQAR